ncbi:MULTISPECIES: hypothetical protein [Burkholderiaceae]|uniref:hypothetical protein n=1 Tax=Burkholderiaceae TaxID=119060 RepID=UPI00095C7648|nr:MULTISPECIES: hypothetical protein [Burkholderiaceae]MCG1018578.1 hypothetical protein [Mycetohabitans sp. B4]SIT75736.1 hypothetical protein SAMN04487768_3262 [Burkholderia sp. b13]
MGTSRNLAEKYNKPSSQIAQNLCAGISFNIIRNYHQRIAQISAALPNPAAKINAALASRRPTIPASVEFIFPSTFT